MPPFHVIVTDHMPGPYNLEEEAMGGLARVVGLGAHSEADLDERIADADGLFVYHEVTITPAVVARLRRCRVIARCGVGYDNVDLRACGAAGIVVCNVPDYGVEEVAEHALALLLAVWRKIPFQDAGVRAGIWDCRRPAPVRRLSGSTLGIVGLGRIGTATALRARAFGLRVIFCDPYVPDGRDKALSLERVDLPELLARSDAVSLHVPLTEETHHLIGAEALRAMKPGAILINTARGPVVDQAALAAALSEGRLSGAGLDVLEREPPTPAELAALHRENVVITPHSAFYSEEAFRELRTKAAREIARVLRGEPPRNAVNAEWLAR